MRVHPCAHPVLARRSPAQEKTPSRPLSPTALGLDSSLCKRTPGQGTGGFSGLKETTAQHVLTLLPKEAGGLCLEHSGAPQTSGDSVPQQVCPPSHRLRASHSEPIIPCPEKCHMAGRPGGGAEGLWAGRGGVQGGESQNPLWTKPNPFGSSLKD